MRKSTVLVVLAVVMILFVTVTPATAASKPLFVRIVADTVFSDAPMKGVFRASGPAVDAGLVCPSGTILDLKFKATGGSNGHVQIFKVTKKFTCADGSGSFNIKLVARSDQKGPYGSWVTKGGKGDYDDLHGSGKLVGIGYSDGSGIQDIYTGKVHLAP